MKVNQKPNLVIFLGDQLRADALGHLGNSAAVTPNFDRIPREDGVSFRHAYSQSNVCVPSRCSFLTGWYPHTRGHRTMHYLLEKEDPMLLKDLKKQGYHVLWLGRNDVIPQGMQLEDYCDTYYSGFDFSSESIKAFMQENQKWEQAYRGSPEGDQYYSFFAGKLETTNGLAEADWNCVKHAVEFIENRSNDEKPFCIYISLLFPHPPYMCEEPWYSLIDRDKIEQIRPIPKDWDSKASMLKGIYDKQQLQTWDEARLKELRATYHAMVSRVDYQFGMIVEALKSKKYYEDAALFVLSDHGDYTGDYGIVEKTQNTFEDPANHVPFIIKPPKHIRVKPRITNALGELLDLSATIAEFVGYEIEHTQFGKSIVPVLTGCEFHRDAVFTEGGRIHGEIQAMEGGHGKTSQYWPRLSTQESEGPEHTKAVMVRKGDYKYIERLYEENELYDLKNDPFELNNLIHDEKHSELVQEMKHRLLRFYMETTDYVPTRKDKRTF